MMQRVLITGGQGFVGRALAVGASAAGLSVRISSRRMSFGPDELIRCFQVGELGATTNWADALEGVNAVVHCAGRAHVLRDAAIGSLDVFRAVNVDGTMELARQAVDAGVKRFVFISSIGVNGLQTEFGKPFSELDKPNPHNAYAVSKWEAEQGLLRFADETGLEVVIIRPPLVYGLGAPGNFGSLTNAIRRGWPLPLGAVHNQRSFVALDNLVDFIVTSLTHSAAANQTFLVSDGQDISTSELVYGMVRASGVRVLLLPVPVWILHAGASLLGRGDAVQRLCSNLQVDISKARNLLGWAPPLSVAEGLSRAMVI